jgi:putative Holliday junction resolvase
LKVLAIDHGERKIGLAVSDELGLIARPLTILIHRSRAEDAQAVADLAAAEGAARIVVGLPLDAEGREGHQARLVRRWAEGLREACSLPVEFWDESLTTAAAADIRRETGARKPRRRAGSRGDGDDAVAAAVLLQSYLDAHRTTQERRPDA